MRETGRIAGNWNTPAHLRRAEEPSSIGVLLLDGVTPRMAYRHVTAAYVRIACNRFTDSGITPHSAASERNIMPDAIPTRSRVTATRPWCLRKYRNRLAYQ